MNFLSFARYLAQWVRFPGSRDYLNRGQGIVERRKAALRYWEPHERSCKEFQRRALQGLKVDRSIVLGAGRLNDIDLDSLAFASKHIYLFDIDPGAQAAWKKAALVAARHDAGLSGEIRDITGTIAPWTNQLGRAAAKFRSLEESCAFLDSLSASAPALPVGEAEVLLSVNVLSQLSVFWRDRVIDLLAKYKIIPSAGPVELPPQLEQSLQRMGAILERGHLELLRACRPQRVILITDRMFHYYQQNKAAWQSEAALHVDDLKIEGYEVFAADSWLWHLAPQWLEGEDFGVIHEVIAFDLRRAP